MSAAGFVSIWAVGIKEAVWKDAYVHVTNLPGMVK